MKHSCVYQLKRCLFIIVSIGAIIWTINLAVQTLKSSDFTTIINQIPLGDKVNRDMVTKNVASGICIGLYSVSFLSQLLGLAGAFFESYILVFIFTYQQVASALFIGLCVNPPNLNVTRFQFGLAIVAIIYLNALKKERRHARNESNA